MKRLWPLVFTLGLMACASALPSPDSQAIYQLTLSGTLDGVAWSGVAVGSPAKVHELSITSQVDVNYFVVESCHRWEKFEDAIVSGNLFQWNGKRTFDWEYHMAPGIEDTGDCTLRLYAFTKQVGANQSYGLMVFKSPQFTLPAENICNGADGMASGTSICQSFNGLKERLRFKQQVIVAPPDVNNKLIARQCVGHFVDAYTYEYTMPLGECVLVFGTTSKPYLYSYHLAYGFSKTQYGSGQ